MYWPGSTIILIRSGVDNKMASLELVMKRNAPSPRFAILTLTFMFKLTRHVKTVRPLVMLWRYVEQRFMTSTLSVRKRDTQRSDLKPSLTSSTDYFGNIKKNASWSLPNWYDNCSENGLAYSSYRPLHTPKFNRPLAYFLYTHALTLILS